MHPKGGSFEYCSQIEEFGERVYHENLGTAAGWVKVHIGYLSPNRWFDIGPVQLDEKGQAILDVPPEHDGLVSEFGIPDATAFWSDDKRFWSGKSNDERKGCEMWPACQRERACKEGTEEFVSEADKAIATVSSSSAPLEVLTALRRMAVRASGLGKTCTGKSKRLFDNAWQSSVDALRTSLGGSNSPGARALQAALMPSSGAATEGPQWSEIAQTINQVAVTSLQICATTVPALKQLRAKRDWKQMFDRAKEQVSACERTPYQPHIAALQAWAAFVGCRKTELGMYCEAACDAGDKQSCQIIDEITSAEERRDREKHERMKSWSAEQWAEDRRNGGLKNLVEGVNRNQLSTACSQEEGTADCLNACKTDACSRRCLANVCQHACDLGDPTSCKVACKKYHVVSACRDRCIDGSQSACAEVKRYEAAAERLMAAALKARERKIAESPLEPSSASTTGSAKAASTFHKQVQGGSASS